MAAQTRSVKNEKSKLAPLERDEVAQALHLGAFHGELQLSDLKEVGKLEENPKLRQTAQKILRSSNAKTKPMPLWAKWVDAQLPEPTAEKPAVQSTKKLSKKKIRRSQTRKKKLALKDSGILKAMDLKAEQTRKQKEILKDSGILKAMDLKAEHLDGIVGKTRPSKKRRRKK